MQTYFKISVVLVAIMFMSVILNAIIFPYNIVPKWFILFSFAVLVNFFIMAIILIPNNKKTTHGTNKNTTDSRNY